jgi:MFS transporter, DHA1 family, multidrug resistance protein
VVFFGLTVFMGMGNGICLPNANAGMLSVRPELAGTASGLGGAILIGGGAALAALAGVLLGPGATNAAGPADARLLGRVGVAILFVIRRARHRQIGA